MVVLRQIILVGLGFFIDLNSFINQYQFRQATYLFRLSFLAYMSLVFYHLPLLIPPIFRLNALHSTGFIPALSLYGLPSVV